MKKWILTLLFTLFVIFRFAMTFPWLGEGRSQTSPSGEYTAHVMEFETEYFWGGKKRYSRFEITDAAGRNIFESRYTHNNQGQDWYLSGKIVWDSDKKVHFDLYGVRLLSTCVNPGSGLAEIAGNTTTTDRDRRINQ